MTVLVGVMVVDGLVTVDGSNVVVIVSVLVDVTADRGQNCVYPPTLCIDTY